MQVYMEEKEQSHKTSSGEINNENTHSINM